MYYFCRDDYAWPYDWASDSNGWDGLLGEFGRGRSSRIVTVFTYVLCPFAIWGDWLPYTYVALAHLTPPIEA